jgi:hypothetical protein
MTVRLVTVLSDAQLAGNTWVVEERKLHTVKHVTRITEALVSLS